MNKPYALIKLVLTAGCMAVAMSFTGIAAHAQQTATANVTMTAVVQSAASLSFGGSGAGVGVNASNINFSNQNPGSVTSIGADLNPYSVTVNARTASTNTVTLTVQASGALTSGLNTIAVNNVTYTSTSGGGFVANGTMSSTSPQSMGSWTGPGTHSGQFNFYLANSYSYAPGNYSTQVTFTLIAP